MATNGPGSAKQARQRAIFELISRSPISSQEDLVDRLAALGHLVTQATVSRDIAELGLAKVWRGDRHVYVSPDDLAPAPAGAAIVPPDARLRRIVADLPVAVARSGLTLVLRSGPGSASTIAQAIDQSSLDDQVGTLAGDDTVLVLFGDETRLEHWLARFRAIQSGVSLESEAETPPAVSPATARTPVGAAPRPSMEQPS